MTKNRWSKYIDATSEGLFNSVIAERIGVDPATIGRWRTGAVDPKPRQVVAYARAFNLSPVQALVAADYLTAEEVDLPIGEPKAYSLDDFTTLELAEELVSRIEVGEGYRTWTTKGAPTLARVDENGDLVPFEGGAIRDDDTSRLPRVARSADPEPTDEQ